MNRTIVPSPPRPGSIASTIWLSAARTLSRVTAFLYRATSGRLGGTFLGTPVLLLDHIGRRSDRRRTAPLHYIRHGTDLVVAGSRAGSGAAPDWWLNLQAHPQTTIRIGQHRIAVTAREALDEHRELLWSLLVRQIPELEIYQGRTSRTLPVIVLTPREEPPAAAGPGPTGTVVGWLSHGRALTSPIAVTAVRAAREENQAQRLQRLRGAARDRLEQRRRPTRPTMRALRVAPGGRFSWQSVPTPRGTDPKSAIVRPLAAATCDLDRPLALGLTPFPLPLHFGHECVAEVLSVGDDVCHVTPGERVILPFQVSCGSCDRCQAGLTANCRSVPPISMYGFGVGGGHWGGVLSDQIEVPFADAMLVALPDGVDPVAAASVADNVSDAYRHVAPHLPAVLTRDQRAPLIIVGPTHRRSRLGGSVPLYAGLVAKALGAGDVYVVDARPNVRSLAERLGLAALPHNRRCDLQPAPIVIDTSGTGAGLRAALLLTARDGICTSAGALHSSTRLLTGLMYARNITVHITRAHARSIIPDVLGLMTSDQLHPELITTTVADLDSAPTALHEHVTGDAIKTVLTAN